MRVVEAIRWLSSLPPDAEIDLAVRSVRMNGERRAPRSSAERMREKRARDREAELERSDGPPSQSVTDVTKSDESDDGRNGAPSGGPMGGLPPESPEKLAEETGDPGSNLTGQDAKTAAARDASDEKTSRHAISGTASERAQVRRVFEAWQQDTGHYRKILDRKRGSRILARLREGFTPERLIVAISHRHNDPFLMGVNDRGRVYDEIETLLRDAAQVERLEALTAPERSRAGINGSRNAAPSLLARAQRITEDEHRAAQAAGETA